MTPIVKTAPLGAALLVLVALPVPLHAWCWRWRLRSRVRWKIEVPNCGCRPQRPAILSSRGGPRRLRCGLGHEFCFFFSR